MGVGGAATKLEMKQPKMRLNETTENTKDCRSGGGGGMADLNVEKYFLT